MTGATHPPPAPPPGFSFYESRKTPFLDWFGPIFVNRDGGRLRFGMRAMPHHSNGRSVHGGVLLSLTDLVLGMSIRETCGPAATVSLNSDFVAAANVGDWIEGEASITRQTSSLVFVRGVIEAEGRIAVTAAGVWKILRPRDGTPAGSGGR